MESEEARPSHQIESTRTKDRWQRLSNVSPYSGCGPLILRTILGPTRDGHALSLPSVCTPPAKAVRPRRCLWGLSALPSSASTGVDSLLPFFHLFLLYPLFLSRSPCFQTQFRNAVRASLFRGRRQESKHETALLYRMAPQLALSVASVNSVSGHAVRGMATDTIYLWARFAPDYSI